uniref:Uncharacterized protein n=1 Tax=Phragmatopoma lapidosa TaxID=341668 RepID=A0A0A0QYD3_9ANNE|nr:hypothetical protein [Phragmatopoma lapidosa]
MAYPVHKVYINSKFLMRCFRPNQTRHLSERLYGGFGLGNLHQRDRASLLKCPDYSRLPVVCPVYPRLLVVSLRLEMCTSSSAGDVIPLSTDDVISSNVGDVKLNRRSVNTVEYLVRKYETVSRQTITDLVLLLTEFGIKQRTISKWINTAPHIFDIKLKTVENSINLLLEYGFKVEKLMPIICHPEVNFDVKESRLLHMTQMLRAIDLKEGRLHEVICRNPSVLFVSPHVVEERYNQLMQVFPKTHTVNILTDFPNLFTEEWAEISPK